MLLQGYSSVVNDGKCLQMWYRPWRSAIAYATSCDGVNWTKPALGMWDAEEALLDGNGFIDRVKSKDKYFWWDEGQALRSGWRNLTIINRRWR